MSILGSISQNIITNKLTKYLRILKRDYCSGEKIDRSGGLCFGFSVCYSSMDVIGKLDWWLDMLRAIVAWDEKEESLKEVKSINGSREALTLEQIFERVINDIVSNHFQPEGISDNDIIRFSPINAYKIFDTQLAALRQGSFFEISNEGETKTIQDNLFVAEKTYTDTEFESVITQERVEGNICIIIGKRQEGDGKHACALRFDGEKWFFYDPYVDEGEKEFDNKNDLVTHIFLSLTNTIQIQFASLEKGAFTFTSDKEKEELFCRNLKANSVYSGLYTTLKFAPEQFDYLFSKAEEAPGVRQAITETLFETKQKNHYGFLTLAELAPKYLTNVFHQAEQYQDVRGAIVQAISSKSAYSGSCSSPYWRKAVPGLFMFVTLAPSYLANLFQLAEQHQDVREAVANAMIASKIDNLSDEFISNMINLFQIEDIEVLLLQNENAWRVLQIILLYEPRRFEKLIELAETDIDIRNSLADALLKQNTNKKPVLGIITEKAPMVLKPLFGLAAKSQKIRDVVEKSLQDDTTFYFFAENAKNQLEHLFILADKDEKVMAALAEKLLKRDKSYDSYSPLEMIAINAPEQLQRLFNLAEKYPEIRSKIAEALPSSGRVRGCTTLHIFAKSSPAQLSDLFHLADGNPQVITSLAEALKKVWYNVFSASAFDEIVKSATEQLKDLFRFAKDHEEIRDSIKSILKSKPTTLLGIAKSGIEQLMDLFELAKSDRELKDVVIEAFKTPTVFFGDTCLTTIAKKEKSEEELEMLFSYAEHDPDLLSAIAIVIPIPNFDNGNALAMMAKSSPIQLKRLITFAEGNDKIADAIAKALPLHSETQIGYGRYNITIPTLQIIAQNCPAELDRLAKLANQNEEIKNGINAAIEITIKNMADNSEPKEAVYLLIQLYKHLQLDIESFAVQFQNKAKSWIKYIDDQYKPLNASALFKSSDLLSKDKEIAFILRNKLAEMPNSEEVSSQLEYR